MANKKHMKILKKGVAAWNEWRVRHPEIRPDLSGSNFNRADLSGAILFQADLSGSSFIWSVLAGVDFQFANLTWSQLDGADVGDSTMGYTSLGNTGLANAKGLETVRHTNPSTIGIDTIFRSRGKIPGVFLRGAGVPESFITYMESLVVEPIQYYSCFISYSSKDEDFAKRLHRDLQGEQVRCWFAPKDLKIGERFRERIDEAVRVYDKLLLVLSETSIQSPWVEDEVEAAFEKERHQNRLVLFPIRLDDAVMTTGRAWAARVRRILHMGDFREWKSHDKYKEAFGRLMLDLKAEEKGPGEDGSRKHD